MSVARVDDTRHTLRASRILQRRLTVAAQNLERFSPDDHENRLMVHGELHALAYALAELTGLDPVDLITTARRNARTVA